MRWVLTLLLTAAIAALAVLMLTARTAEARTNVFSPDGTDPRVSVASLGGPSRFYAPIAKVTTLSPVVVDDGSSIKTRGTGFLVSPCLLLTNFHAVFGHAVSPLAPDGPAVQISLNTSGDEALKTFGSPVAWGAMSNAGEDWALVRLQDCVGGRSDVGWYDLDPGPEKQVPTYSLDTAGYPGDRNGLAAATGCRIHAVADHVALNDCANRPGDSGSPLFRLADGAPAVVAIQQGHHGQAATVFETYSPAHANMAVPAAQVLSHPEVSELILADRQAYGADNPLSRPPAQIEAAPLPPVVTLTTAPAQDGADPSDPPLSP